MIQSASSYRDISYDDLECINMSGKQASVPQYKDGLQWDGRAVKELAGSGCILCTFIERC